MARRADRRIGRGFSLVELLVVVVVLGVLAAIAVPSMARGSEEARTQALVAGLERARAALAAHRQEAALGGEQAFPDLDDLVARGGLMRDGIQDNPLTGVAGVREVSGADASARAVGAEAAFGWAYHADNDASPPIAVFYANTTRLTTRRDPATGAYLRGNEL